MLVAGVIGLGAIILFAMMMFSGGPSAADKATNVYLRLQTLESLATDNQKALRNNDLRSLNSGLGLQFTNALSDMSDSLTALKIDTKKISKTAQADEDAYKAALQTEFDDAKLNVQLDSVYTREMTYQIATLRTMMQSVTKASSNKTLSSFVSSTDEKLAPFEDNFSGFSAN